MNEVIPDLVKGALLFLFGGGGYKLYDEWTKRRTRHSLAPVERNKAVADLTDALQESAKEAVANMREEVRLARVDLLEARQQMREQERAHKAEVSEARTLMERMRRRIDQLVSVLRENDITVPLEKD